MKCFLFIIIARLLHWRVCGEQINHINFVDYIPRHHHKNYLFAEGRGPDCTHE